MCRSSKCRGLFARKCLPAACPERGGFVLPVVADLQVQTCEICLLLQLPSRIVAGVPFHVSLSAFAL